MDTREREAIETLSMDAMVDAMDLFKHMGPLTKGSGYRLSLPGQISCSRSAVDQLKLYSKGREPRQGEKRPLGPHRLYRREQLHIVHRRAVVTFCDGFEKLSRHQFQDRDFAREFPERRGEGRALDVGFRNLTTQKFVYDDEAPLHIRILLREAVDFLKARGWFWGHDLWGWDENHLEKH